MSRSADGSTVDQNLEDVAHIPYVKRSFITVMLSPNGRVARLFRSLKLWLMQGMPPYADGRQRGIS